ncbi:YbaB/EbfC family DNA-binding protein [Asanoa siamensis]|uniref:YbaB/EbfC family DNA-binding protein n=1 Tax=Asanoa siamensis TaxID=926357 RepID=UPI0019444523|nr:YbaB/EbfC family DNA-binding protein [Asanoa siamensis]
MTDASGLTDILGTLAALSTGATPAAVGEGVAADGLIVARAAMPGQVTGIELDPAVLGLDLASLAAELTAAVNAALTDLRTQAGVGGDAVDLGALGGQLREIQESTVRQFSAFTESLLDAQSRLARRADDAR